MSEYTVRIRGEESEDDGLQIDMGPIGERAWWELPLPACPDCGGDLVWYEGGYVPGTRKCMGEPVGGRVTNPIMDRRVPLIGADADDVRDSQFCVPLEEWERLRVLSLYAERNVCSDDRVRAIDAELLTLLDRHVKLEYTDGAGCGSLFSVQTEDGSAYVRRERFF